MLLTAFALESQCQAPPTTVADVLMSHISLLALQIPVSPVQPKHSSEWDLLKYLPPVQTCHVLST